MTQKSMIRIEKEVRELLRGKKKYKRETYSEVIKREILKARGLKGGNY